MNSDVRMQREEKLRESRSELRTPIVSPGLVTSSPQLPNVPCSAVNNRVDDASSEMLSSFRVLCFISLSFCFLPFDNQVMIGRKRNRTRPTRQASGEKTKRRKSPSLSLSDSVLSFLPNIQLDLVLLTASRKT